MADPGGGRVGGAGTRRVPRSHRRRAAVFEGARGGDGVAISVVRDTARISAWRSPTWPRCVDPEILSCSADAVADAGDLLPSSRSAGVCPTAAAGARAEPIAFRYLYPRRGTASPSARRGWRCWHGMIRWSLSGADIVSQIGCSVPARSSSRDPHRRCHAGDARPAADGITASIANHYTVPGFIDVHVHGVEGTDTLDGGDAIATIAERLPRYGVTGVLPDVDRVRARGAADDCWTASAPRGSTRRPVARARAAGASREQLHQPRLSRARSRSSACACQRRQPDRRATFTGARDPRRDRGGAARRRDRHHRAGDRRRAGSHSRSRVARASRLARALRARPTSRRWRASTPAPDRRRIFSIAMTPLAHRAAWLAGRRSRARRSDGRDHLRRRSRASRDGAAGSRGERPDRRSWRSPMAPPAPDCRAAPARPSAAGRSPSATPPTSTTGRWRAAC